MWFRQIFLDGLRQAGNVIMVAHEQEQGRPLSYLQKKAQV
jgi:hypothetical protein